jgi:hypothetical protein
LISGTYGFSQGMSTSEFAKLKERLQATKGIKKRKVKEDGEVEVDKDGRKQEEIVNKIKDSLNSLVFGSQLFDNPPLNFEPNLKLATQ